MKDIIRFHGYSCEALYYTAAICRLICSDFLPVTAVNGILNIDPSLGHAMLLQRMDTEETWMDAWKDGVHSWNPIKIFGTPNEANPLPYKWRMTFFLHKEEPL